MPTYAENQAATERTARKNRQDRHLAANTRLFDAQTAANTDKRGGWKAMKYERKSFTVVTASDAYRSGYDRIVWGNDPQASMPDSTTADAVQRGPK